MRILALTLAATALAATSLAGTAQAATLHALTSDGKLLMLDSEQRRASRPVMVGKTAGRVAAIALRPADGKLYGLTDGNQIVVIDPTTGAVTPGAKLDKPLETGPRTTINFNPAVDRLRVIGASGNNYRIHPDTGAVTVDGALKYAPASPNAGAAPRVTAAAYTNHVAGTKETALYTIDTVLGQMNLQAPPNDGVQTAKKDLGSLPNGIGFDIVADAQGTNTGYMIVGSSLKTLALADLVITDRGKIAGLPTAEIISLAAR